jgi:hypothetical protein
LTDRFNLYSANGIQFLCYLVPGPAGETAPGRRRVNWVWYINASEAAFAAVMTGQSGRRYRYFLPADDVSAASKTTLLTLADSALPPLMSRLVGHSKPFLQPVMDLASERLRRGPVFLIGDAAGTVRPHTPRQARRNRSPMQRYWRRHCGAGKLVIRCRKVRLPNGRTTACVPSKTSRLSVLPVRSHHDSAPQIVRTSGTV